MKESIPISYRAGIWLAVSAAIVSGFAVYINGFAVKNAPSPLSFTLAKNLVAAAIIGAILCATSARGKAAPALRELRPAQWLALLYVGVIGGGLAFALFFQGLAAANATESAFVQKSLIIWVAVLAVPVLHEKIGKRQLLAIGLLLVGQILLVGTLSGAKPGTLAALGQVLIATLLWAGEIVIVRRMLRSLPASLLGTVRLGVGAVVLAIWLASTYGLGQLATMGSGWEWALLTGVILAGYVLTWFGALRRAEAVDVTAILVVGAFVTALLAMPSAGIVTAVQVAGMVLIIGGAIVIVRPRAAPPPATGEA
ncbi:MAG: DMT family transporter [Candidatus Nanopelagicales bacterium]